MTQSTQLRFSLLGSPTATYGQQSLSIGRSQVRALLYCLATSLQPVSRELLTFMFWPDTAEGTARRNLTQLLSHLRRALPIADALLATSDAIQLDPNLVWSDTVAFEDLCAAQDNDDRQHLQDALALYRDAFLSGVSFPQHPEFESWMLGERARFETLYLDTLRTMSAYYADQGHYAEAIQCAQRHLAIDELAEDVHRQLIELYAAAGDRGAALRHYEDCQRILERELGVGPLPETQAVYQRILSGSTSTSIIPQPEPHWTTWQGIDTPLVGRDQFLEELERIYQSVETDGGQIVLLTGEAGIGKSRLMQDFANQLQAHDDVLILATAGYESTRSVPYQPIIEALQPLLHTMLTVHQVPDGLLMTVAQLFPELRTLHPDLGLATSAEPDQEHSQLFEALRQLLMSASATTLLCIDDLQWTDDVTLAWLSYVVRHLRDSQLLIIGTYRSEEIDAVARLRRELRRLSMLVELKLGPLADGEVRQILHQMNVPHEQSWSARLQTLTKGNPFFLAETIRMLFEKNRFSTATTISEETLPLADSVRDVVQTRLGNVSRVGQQILEAGAVLGSIFAFNVIYQVAGRNEMETLDGLDELAAFYLLEEDGDNYRFHHDLIRSAVYQGLSHWRRKLLHRRAGETLESRLRTDGAGQRSVLVAQIGHHYVEAGEGAQAIPYLLETGDQARVLYAPDTAIDYYERALLLLEEEHDSIRMARTLMKLGLTYHTAFRYQESQRAYEQGFALWQQTTSNQPQQHRAAAPHPLRIDVQLAPVTCDPAKSSDTGSVIIMEQLFSGLMHLDRQLNIIPDVAQSWEVQEEGRQWIFHLRPDVYWSDGMAVTAHDFAYAWRRVLNPATASPIAALLYAIQGARAYHQGEQADPQAVGIHALDNVTLKIELEEPASYFPYLLTRTVCFPVPRHIIDVWGDAWTAVAHVVTNGPFTLETWELGKSVRLARNSAYHGPAAGNVQQVELILHKDWPARRELYTHNRLDLLWLFYPPSLATEQMRRQHVDNYMLLPWLGVDFVVFDTTRPPLMNRMCARPLPWRLIAQNWPVVP